jgi:hypothetical protein
MKDQKKPNRIALTESVLPGVVKTMFRLPSNSTNELEFLNGQYIKEILKNFGISNKFSCQELCVLIDTYKFWAAYPYPMLFSKISNLEDYIVNVENFGWLSAIWNIDQDELYEKIRNLTLDQKKSLILFIEDFDKL